MPLGDKMSGYVASEKNSKCRLPIETQKCPAESKEDSQQKHTLQVLQSNS